MKPADPLPPDGTQLLRELEELVATKEPRDRWIRWIDWVLIRDATTPLLMSTAGLILTGVLFDWVQHWQAFTTLTELFILVPIVFSVKGNIELSLGSRLSTAANLGHFDGRTARKELLRFNLALIIFQSLLCGFIVGLGGCVLGLLVHRGRNGLVEDLIIVTASVVTCGASSFITCGMLAGIIWIAHKWDLADPDNVASPIAASLGDFSTLTILSVSAHVLLMFRSLPLLITILSILGAAFAVSFYFVKKDAQGWSVIVGSMPPLLFSFALTSISGLILERYTLALPGLVFLLPVTSGICNNFSAIYASRLSTNLIDPECDAITVRNRRTILTMTVMNVTVQGGLLAFIGVFGVAHFRVDGALVGVCVGTSTTCLLAVLGLVRPLAKWLHAHNFDLHSYSIPLLAALGDLLGALLLIVFMLILLH